MNHVWHVQTHVVNVWNKTICWDVFLLIHWRLQVHTLPSEMTTICLYLALGFWQGHSLTGPSLHDTMILFVCPLLCLLPSSLIPHKLCWPACDHKCKFLQLLHSSWALFNSFFVSSVLSFPVWRLFSWIKTEAQLKNTHTHTHTHNQVVLLSLHHLFTLHQNPQTLA